MKFQFRFRLPALLTLSTVLFAACASPRPDQQFPLQCSQCAFTEAKGVRVVSGKLHNDSSKTIETVTLAVKFQDAKGNLVAEENIALPIPALNPQDTREFSVRVSNNAPPVTQALIRFETAKGGDRLSSDVALLLVVGLDQDQ